jgi:hypothetical protein
VLSFMFALHNLISEWQDKIPIARLVTESDKGPKSDVFVGSKIRENWVPGINYLWRTNG